jgi:hypothetical protein
VGESNSKPNSRGTDSLAGQDGLDGHWLGLRTEEAIGNEDADQVTNDRFGKRLHVNWDLAKGKAVCPGQLTKIFLKMLHAALSGTTPGTYP